MAKDRFVEVYSQGAYQCGKNYCRQGNRSELPSGSLYSDSGLRDERFGGSERETDCHSRQLKSGRLYFDSSCLSVGIEKTY